MTEHAAQNERAWYLVHTKPRQECMANSQLQRQGYQTYLPMLSRRQSRRGQASEVIEPMFPRYLFIYLSEVSDNWSPIRSTIGVANLVRFSQYPARVPDALIQLLQARENNEGIHVDEGRQFRSGERVRLISGPLEGCEGLFETASGQDRVLILMQVAGRQTSVRVDRHQIESA